MFQIGSEVRIERRIGRKLGAASMGTFGRDCKATRQHRVANVQRVENSEEARRGGFERRISPRARLVPQRDCECGAGCGRAV